MSYNITSFNVISVKDFRINREVWKFNFAEIAEIKIDINGNVQEIEFRGEGSGHNYKEKMLPFLADSTGILESWIVWEGGDSFSGLRIVDGKVTEPEIIIWLEDE